jgi:HlyD family secretion protein
MQIDSGLSTNEEVVIAPYNALSRSLKNGSAVEIVKKDELFKGEEKK